MSRPTLWLASRSPRRLELLRQAAIAATVFPADLDDADLTHGAVPPRQWVMALAYFKARRVRDMLASRLPPDGGLILAADTECVCDGHVLGQPTSRDEARSMLRSLRSRVHQTMSGVCLLCRRTSRRWMFTDEATVRIGALPDESIESYISSDLWRGKAGGYNLLERVEAGWSIEWEGDATCVMGLPMQRLTPLLQRKMDEP